MDQRLDKQLTARDRLLISQLKAKKRSQAEIARWIGKDKSTVSRELRRNAIEVTAQDRLFHFRIGQFWTAEQLDELLETQPAETRKTEVIYSHSDAHLIAINRAYAAQQKRRRKRPETREWIVEGLESGRLRARASESEGRRSSTSSAEALRQAKERLAAREYAKKTPAPSNRVSIEKRPAIVEKRSRLGDCEADLIVGYKQSGFILSVIDRTSRAVVLRKLETIFFAHPYCSSERGSIENLNGLVRDYLRKGTFADLTQDRLDEIATLLNDRPRKCLGYLTPYEVQSTDNHLCTLQRVALDG